MIRVFVGTDGEIHQKAEKVLEYSIRKNTAEDVELTFMRPGWKTPPTGFASHRYLVPKLCNYKGFAIYLDVDMLVLGDLRELWNYRTKGKWCITRIDAKRGPRDEVSVIDCGAFKDLPPETILKQQHGKWAAKNKIRKKYIVNIPKNWNSIDKLESDTKILHYSCLGTQPWHPEQPIRRYRPHKDKKAANLFWEYFKEATNGV